MPESLPSPELLRTEALSARGYVGLANRKTRNASEEQKANARRDLVVANIRRYVCEQLATAPPLTEEQRQRITELLRAGGGGA